jgi:hypothetical protein
MVIFQQSLKKKFRDRRTRSPPPINTMVYYGFGLLTADRRIHLYTNACRVRGRHYDRVRSLSTSRRPGRRTHAKDLPPDDVRVHSADCLLFIFVLNILFSLRVCARVCMCVYLNDELAYVRKTLFRSSPVPRKVPTRCFTRAMHKYLLVIYDTIRVSKRVLLQLRAG